MATTGIETASADQAHSVPRFDTEVLDEEELRRVRLGRSRFLRRAGLTVFGLAMTAAIKASPAYACTAGPTPICGPSHKCCCCNAQVGCCDPGCSGRNSGCGSGGYGWYTCYQGTYYFCGDYWSPTGGDPCVCPIPVQTGCP
jgi:hypothetical protein